MFWVKALVSGLIIALASTIARRSPPLAALIVSLPLVSVLSMIWLWREDPDAGRMAVFVQGTFWYFLPSIPMFLVIPALLRRGFGFWPALLAGCAMTVFLYLAMTAVLNRAGIRI